MSSKVFNDGWWEDFFGTVDKTYTHNEDITEHKNFSVARLNGYVEDIISSGLRLRVTTGTGNYSSVVGKEVFIDSDEWIFEIDFSLVNELPDVPLISFMIDEESIAPLSSASYLSKVLFSFEVGNYVLATGFDVYLLVRDSSGALKYWDGASLVGVKTPVSGVKLSMGEVYKFHFKRDGSNFKAFLFSFGAAPAKLFSYAVSASSVSSSGGWVFVGNYLDDVVYTVPGDVFLKAFRRGKGVKTSFPVAETLPKFLKFEMKDRDRTFSNSRLDSDAHVYDGSNLFLPVFRKMKVRETPKDIYHSIEVSEEGRLDRVSFRFYDTSELWWVIAMVNDISKPFEVKAGVQVRIPPMDVINLELKELLGFIKDSG